MPSLTELRPRADRAWLGLPGNMEPLAAAALAASPLPHLMRVLQLTSLTSSRVGPSKSIRALLGRPSC